MLSERIKRLRDRQRSATPTICLDRARLVTEYYHSLSTEPVVLRRAHFFKYFLERRHIFIDPDSILCGHQASRLVGCPVFVDVLSWLSDEIETCDTRPFDPYQFLPGEKDELRKLAAEWKGHTFGDYTKSQIDEKYALMEQLGVFTIGSREKDTGSDAPDYYNLIKRGYRYYIDECKAKLAELDALDEVDVEKVGQKNNWEAFIIALGAIIDHAHRYADLAEKMAGECDDPERKLQLLTMAENCRVVPEFAPRNFHQATQLVWFTHLAFMLEGNGHNHCLGRFDQYMYPFYKADIAAGVTEEFISDLVNELKLKVAEIKIYRPAMEAESYAGCPLWMHMFLGGQLANGKDACNPLTDLVLRSILEMPTKEPAMSFRYHNNINRDTFRLALECVRSGNSHPAFFNDNVCVPNLLSMGYNVKEAREYCVCGCVENMVPGITDENANVGFFNPYKILEITLHNGKDPMSGKQIGPHTGDARLFTSMDQVLDAFRAQLNYFAKAWLNVFSRVHSCHAHMLPTLTASCFTQGCIEKGKVLQQGAALHTFSVCAVTSPANVADSLAAMDVCVFKEKYMTMAELMDLIDSDFAGQESKRQLLLNRAPKYGNNDPLVDDYARLLYDWFNDDLQYNGLSDGHGGQYTVVTSTQSYNVTLGEQVGAMPDGRKAYTPQADNASPMSGRDTKGPTAALASVAYTDLFMTHTGELVNQRFDPVLLKGEKGLDILESIVRGYFEQYGEHLQVNVVDTETLRAAQENPRDYQNILVRVAGYSAYFVELERKVQDDIISRTLQSTL